MGWLLAKFVLMCSAAMKFLYKNLYIGHIYKFIHVKLLGVGFLGQINAFVYLMNVPQSLSELL